MTDNRPTGFRGAWQHRRWRWLLGSSAVSLTGDFMYQVALVVVLYEETGSVGWVAAATVLRIGIYVFLGPFGGAIADRFPRRQLMVTLDIGRFVTMLLATLVIWLDLPIALLVLLTLVATVQSVPYRAASVAAVPNVVPEDDLAAANAADSVLGQLAFFVGPAVGTAVVATAGTGPAFLLNGLSFAAAALMLTRTGSLGGARGAGEQEAAPTFGAIWGDVVEGAVEVRRSPALIALMVVSGAILFQIGAERVAHVLVAEDVLNRSPDYVGVMAAAMGVGGLLIAPFSARIGASRHVHMYLVTSGLLVGIPFALLGLAESTALSLALLVVAGIGGMVYEVTFITLLQRSASEATLARIFGLNDSVTAVTEIGGALMLPLVVAMASLQVSLWVVGVILSVACLLCLPSLRRDAAQRRAEVERLAPVVSELRTFAIVESLSQGAFERLAAVADQREVAAGAVMVSEGETADRLFLVRSGRFVVDSSTKGRIAELGAGEVFGEIGVLRRVPRTATVTCAEAGSVWELGGEVFVASVTSQLPSLGQLHGTVDVRLARTSPELLAD